jgi:hypothetical protein
MVSACTANGWPEQVPDDSPATSKPVEHTEPAPAPADGRRPEPLLWKLPQPYGRGAAIDAMSGIAAPLLAGFSLTLAGVIAASPAQFRWPGADLAVLVVPVVLLVACIQFGFHARGHLYSAADLHDWRPDFIERHERALKLQQAADYAKWSQWERRARVAYNAAIVVLAVAVAMVMTPPTGAAEPQWRWTAAGIALAAAVAEGAWIFFTTQRGHRAGSAARQWFRRAPNTGRRRDDRGGRHDNTARNG